MELLWLYVMLIHMQHISAVTWLSLANHAVLWDPRGCDGLAGLVEEQVPVCRGRWKPGGGGEARSLLSSSASTSVTCPWNCSTLQGLQVFGKATIQDWCPFLQSGTQESAFIHTISAAGIAFAVTRACSCGELHKCGCDHRIRGVSPEGFQWSGCSDNLSYGIAFSQAFVDSPERSRGVSSSQVLMNLHNNEAGRKPLLAHIRMECKCHGVSGSCEVCACWKVTPAFRQAGSVLKEKFEGATEVYPKRVGSRKLLVPKNSRVEPYTAHDLIYLRASPDFCGREPRHGTFGTPGRRCNRTRLGMDGCELPMDCPWTAHGLPMDGCELCAAAGLPQTRAELVQRPSRGSADAAPSSASRAGTWWRCR